MPKTRKQRARTKRYHQGGRNPEFRGTNEDRRKDTFRRQGWKAERALRRSNPELPKPPRERRKKEPEFLDDPFWRHQGWI